MIEFANMSTEALRKLDVDSNGLSPAAAELRRRQLSARGAGHRDPAELLRQLEQRRTPDYRSPRERAVALYARYGPTATPREKLLKMHAQRIIGGW